MPSSPLRISTDMQTSCLRALSTTVKSLIAVFVATISFGWTATTNAQTQLVTYFNFNDSLSGVPNLVSDAPGQRPSTITTNFNNPTTNVTTQTGTTVNRATGDLSVETFALSLIAGAGTLANGTGGNNGMSLQFNVSTLGIFDLSLSYATRRSGTGFTTQTLAYSLNGVDFTTVGTFSPPNSTTFGTATFDLTAINTIENQANVFFRITFTGATNASGTNAIDNIQLTGIPEPATTAVGLLGVGAICWHQRRRFKGLARLLAA